MFDDSEHEVIDSPEALFRHLYEAHGVPEARDLDPATAPVQFWLRKHADLEHAARVGRAERLDAPGEVVRAGNGRAAPDDPANRGAPTGPPGRAEPSFPSAPPRAPAGRPRPGPQAGSPRPGGAVPSPLLGTFADPLVATVAGALVRRGLDARRVRAWIAAAVTPDGRHRGEAAVRATFVEPMLDAIAAQLTGNAGSRPGAEPAPPVARQAPEPPRAEPATPAPAAGDPYADFMAIADVLQSRRARGRGRRPGPQQAARTGETAAPPPNADADDDMALANAVQRPHRPQRASR